MSNKPLGHKCYGSIPHLPHSRMGPGDHSCTEGEAAIAYGKLRDNHDQVVVLEKLDGSCVGAAKINGAIVPLGRAGYRADTSPYRQHQLFAEWVYYHQASFDRVLNEGERVCGEWLLQAHGSRYNLMHPPFIVFDMFSPKNERYTWDHIWYTMGLDFPTAKVITRTYTVCKEEITIRDIVANRTRVQLGRTDLEYVLSKLEPSGHGCLDPVEGAVWRVERNGKVEFLCKYVRPDKVDGLYLDREVWNDFVGDDWLKQRLGAVYES